MNSLDTLFGTQMPLIAKMLIAFGVIFGVIAIVWLIARRLLPGPRVGGAAARGRQPRLGVLDAHAVDARRKLVLIRRDNVEHLIMIGGPNDVVIESTILRSRAPAIRPGMPQAAGQPMPPQGQPVPLPQQSMDLPPMAPEPVARPVAPPPVAERPAPPRPQPVAPLVPQPARSIEADVAARLETALKRPAATVPEPAAVAQRPAPAARPELPPRTEAIRPVETRPAPAKPASEPPPRPAIELNDLEAALFEDETPSPPAPAAPTQPERPVASEARATAEPPAPLKIPTPEPTVTAESRWPELKVPEHKPPEPKPSESIPVESSALDLQLVEPTTDMTVQAPIEVPPPAEPRPESAAARLRNIPFFSPRSKRDTNVPASAAPAVIEAGPPPDLAKEAAAEPAPAAEAATLSEPTPARPEPAPSPKAPPAEADPFASLEEEMASLLGRTSARKS